MTCDEDAHVILYLWWRETGNMSPGLTDVYKT